MVHDLLNDNVPDLVKPIITAGKLFGIYKTEERTVDRIRPCAVGEAIRRIAAKVQCVQDNPSLSVAFLKEFQFGVAVSGGLEYAYHANRLYLDNLLEGFDDALNDDDGSLDPNDFLLKQPGMLQTDFTNAFNSTCRAKIFARIKLEQPTWLRFFVLCYSTHAVLMVVWAGKVVATIKSRYGTQQGDVLGCHYFAFATLGFCERLARLVPDSQIAWIVDDLTVTGSAEDLLKVRQLCAEEGPSYGLFFATKVGACNLWLPRANEVCGTISKRLQGGLADEP
jgi:hypothetical protein